MENKVSKTIGLVKNKAMAAYSEVSGPQSCAQGVGSQKESRDRSQALEEGDTVKGERVRGK